MLEEQFQKALNSIQSECSKSSAVKVTAKSTSFKNKSLANKKYLIAFSGGMDSHVLLHLCVRAKLPIRAIYINHGLLQQANHWQQHCKRVCEQLQIDFQSVAVDAKPSSGQSPEEAAREARYKALQEYLQQDEYLLTAHHQDDQAETLLLQLMRGAGTAGLASMPTSQIFGAGYHCRPLLACSRDDIKRYAIASKLDWVEDPSNDDISFDRNFIRKKVMPLLQQRWPKVSRVIKKSADIQQENLELIETIAAIDLASVITNDQRIVAIKSLLNLSPARQFNVLKYWIKRAGFDRPTRNILMQIQSTVLTAADDAEPLVAWGNTEIRRFKDELYVMASLTVHDEKNVLVWDVEQKLPLITLDVIVAVQRDVLNGLSLESFNKKIEIKFRCGGEKIKPVGQVHTASLKKLMQQEGIPPWLRSRIPLLYVDGVLACVCGYWLADAFVDKSADGWLPVLKIRGEGLGPRGQG